VTDGAVTSAALLVVNVKVVALSIEVPAMSLSAVVNATVYVSFGSNEAVGVKTALRLSGERPKVPAIECPTV
jgi:hypothetical protein